MQPTTEQSAKAGQLSKTRKPYTLTKQRESWSEDEHRRFLEALQLYNRDWKKIEAHVGTKTVVQIRSHAQKFFQKAMKTGCGDGIPPPRPKRKASAVTTATEGDTIQKSANGSIAGQQNASSSAPTMTAVATSRAQNNQQPAEPQPSTAGPSDRALFDNSYLLNSREDPNMYLVFSYLGSLFDSQFEGTDHIQALRNMKDPEREAALLLMEELSQQVVGGGAGQACEAPAAMKTDKTDGSSAGVMGSNQMDEAGPSTTAAGHNGSSNQVTSHLTKSKGYLSRRPSGQREGHSPGTASRFSPSAASLRACGAIQDGHNGQLSNSGCDEFQETGSSPYVTESGNGLSDELDHDGISTEDDEDDDVEGMEHKLAMLEAETGVLHELRTHSRMGDELGGSGDTNSLGSLEDLQNMLDQRMLGPVSLSDIQGADCLDDKEDVENMDE